MRVPLLYLGYLGYNPPCSSVSEGGSEVEVRPLIEVRTARTASSKTHVGIPKLTLVLFIELLEGERRSLFESLAGELMASESDIPSPPDYLSNPQEVPAEGGPTFRPPSFDEIRAQDMFNNCAVRTVVSGVMGGGMGVFMGALFGALETPVNADTMTTRQHLAHSARMMGGKSFQMAKTFAIMGAIFSGAECLIEKARAKHDTTNTAIAGCVTGGALSARAGPQASCLGCAGFAAFSVVIEKVLDRHD